MKTKCKCSTKRDVLKKKNKVVIATNKEKYYRVFELEDSPVDIYYMANNIEGEHIIKNANSSNEIEAKIKNRKDWKYLLSWGFTYKKI